MYIAIQKKMNTSRSILISLEIPRDDIFVAGPKRSNIKNWRKFNESGNQCNLKHEWVYSKKHKSWGIASEYTIKD